ncbi:MAG: CCA tRNA nucleotidyltransferase, partial [Nitrospirota bacterium]|nr:CCA tRNA nucleotidyltransferase [Nitrospirota bacterium]
MKISRDATFNAALSIVRELHHAGYIAFFAGGCVRDWLLSRNPKDIDIATSAPPDEILRRFPKSKSIGKAFGVVQVLIGDLSFEVATFRMDLSYRDGRRPEAIAFASPEEDAKRRDFGMNGVFYDPIENTCIDFVGGLEDIRHKRLRTIGDPEQRFKEDYLRMLRAIRFAATLSFTIDRATLSAIQLYAPRLAGISVERITPELTQILVKSPRPGDGLKLLHKAGLLNVILPEVCALIGQAQPPTYHPEGDVFTHI